MKRIATHIILILTVMLSAVQVRSQSYPVQTNLYVMAPYSQTYSDYYADGQQRMYVNVLLNDMSQGQLDVVLRFSIKGNNLKLTTNPASPVKPITIQSGRLYRVEGSELAKFLKADQMIAEGRMADEFRKSGRLPEGYYEVKVEVVEYYRKARVSAPAYSTVWIMQPEPPVWTMPQKNSKLEATNPQFVLFGWMMTGNTTMLQNLSYTFSIYEKPANVNADVVVKSATPIYSEEMKQSTLVYGPDKPLLELGKTYACRIKVVDAEGLVSFKNDGYSDVLVFRYGDECLPPSHISITDVSKNGATVNWVGSDSHYGYDIEVREITEGKSSEWYVWNIDKKQCNYDVKQLSPGSKYECRMRAVCGQRSKGIKSPYSETSEFETYAAGNKKYNCGELVQANKYEDRDPHPWLEEGDIIEANGFLFTIESVSKASERVFSGQCSWYIDLWGVSILCDFIDIQVNKHLQLISGKIVACRDKLKAKAFTRLQSTAYQPVGAQVPNTFKPEKVVAVEETVDSIRIVDGQTLIYVAGKEPTKIAATDNVFVKSADGNYYAVADGKVYPKPSNLNSDTGDIELSYTEKITAMFGYDDNMGAHPGVDAYSDEKKAFAAQYDHYQLHSDDAYATWMAKDGSRAAIAKMTVNGGDPSAVQVRSGGQTVTGFGGSDPNALYLPLITDGLYEAYYTTQDTHGADLEVMAGQLNVVSYPQQNINVCLVEVNGASYPRTANELSNYLNDVFGQAVFGVNLTKTSIEVDKFNGTLSARESGALSAYNSDMKKLIRKVKKLPDYTDDTYYIMLVAKSDNPALGGFMPVNSNFGFVFAQANSGAGQMNRTIAHELGHGAFRLWHTFSSENLYTAQQGTTRNLMDYNGTNAELYKYQWDYIHNPQEDIVRWMVEDEEGKYVEESPTDEVVRFLNTIRCAKSNNVDIVDSYHSLNSYSVKVGKLLSIIDNQDGTSSIASDDFKNAVLNVYIDEGMFSSASDFYFGYHQFSIAVNDIKRSNTPAKLTFSTNGKPTIFSVDNTTADISTQNEVLDWIERIVSEPINNFTYNGEIQSLFNLSKCQFEQIGIDTRKTLIKNAFDNIENFLGLDRDTYQYLLINLINSTPATDIEDLINYLSEVCATTESIYSDLSYSAQQSYFQTLCDIAKKYWSVVPQNTVYELILGTILLDSDPVFGKETSVYGARGVFKDITGVYHFGYEMVFSEDGFILQKVGDILDEYEVSAFTPIECKIITNNKVAYTITYPAIAAKILLIQIAERSRAEFINLSLSLLMPASLPVAKVGGESIAAFTKLCNSAKLLTAKVLAPCAKIGYKVRTTSEAIVLSTRLNFEIARFDATAGKLLTKVEPSTTNATHILSFDTDIAYTTTTNVQKTGRLELAQTADGKIIVREANTKVVVESADSETLKRIANFTNNKELPPALKKKINDLPDGGKQFIDDFTDASDDVLRKFVEKPELVDAWDKIRTANPEVSKNIGALEAWNTPKGSRPDPRTYLGDEYVAKHIKEFQKEGKCSRIVSEVSYKRYGIGKPDNGKTEFVSKSSDIDALIEECGISNIKCIAEVLGIPEDQLKGGGLVRIDFDLKKNPNSIDMPWGNEFGANDQWLPGGNLPTGRKEVFIRTEGMSEGVDYNVQLLK